MEKINVIVVEAHNHALEHIHFIIRKNNRQRNREWSRSKRSMKSPTARLQEETLCNVTTACTSASTYSGGRNQIHHPKQQAQAPIPTLTPNTPEEHIWTMVHFDSHPDLACPGENIPALACFLPRKEWDSSCCSGHHNCGEYESCGSMCRVNNDGDDDHHHDETKNLYELLDTSQGGIAEWIIPLVLGAGLRNVHWVKNPWCHQFQMGLYDFGVGAYIDHTKYEGIEGRGVEKRKGISSKSMCRNAHSNACTKITSSTSGQEEYQKVQSFLDLPDNAVVKCTLRHPYYIDDNSHVHASELEFGEKLQLIVTEVDSDGGDRRRKEKDDRYVDECKVSSRNNEIARAYSHDQEDWILDVCLDYFYCSNPFIDEIEALDKDTARLLVRIVSETKFRHMALGLSETGSSLQSGSKAFTSEEQKEQYVSYLREFTRLVKKLLKRIVSVTINTPTVSEILSVDQLGQSARKATSLDSSGPSFLSNEEYHQLYKLYVSPTEGECLWNDFVHTVIHWHFQVLRNRENALVGNKHDTCSRYKPSNNQQNQSPIEELVKVISNALPNLNLPHVGDDFGASSVDRDGTLTPSIQAKVKEFGKYLRRHEWERTERYSDTDKGRIVDHLDYIPKNPMCITIARSCDDGFTPLSLVESLQEAVLQEIHSIYCRCPRSQFSGTNASSIASTDNEYDQDACRLGFIFDYGENEGSSLEEMYK